MIIESLKLQSKNNSNIFIAKTSVGEYVLHGDIIVKNAISIGAAVDEELMNLCVFDSANIIAFNLAVKYINSGIKTEKQIRDYLYKKEFHKQTVDVVMNKLKEYSIVGDKQYAESYIRSNTNFSKQKIQQKLMLAGVDKSTLQETTKEINDTESCFINAKKFLKNKQADKTILDKLVRRLYSQGYNWDSISFVLSKLKLEIEECDNI